MLFDFMVHAIFACAGIASVWSIIDTIREAAPRVIMIFNEELNNAN